MIRASNLCLLPDGNKRWWLQWLQLIPQQYPNFPGPFMPPIRYHFFRLRYGYMACFHFSGDQWYFWAGTSMVIASGITSLPNSWGLQRIAHQTHHFVFRRKECNVQLLFHYKPTCSHLSRRLPLVFCLHHSLHLLSFSPPAFLRWPFHLHCCGWWRCGCPFVEQHWLSLCCIPDCQTQISVHVEGYTLFCTPYPWILPAFEADPMTSAMTVLPILSAVSLANG